MVHPEIIHPPPCLCLDPPTNPSLTLPLTCDYSLAVVHSSLARSKDTFWLRYVPSLFPLLTLNFIILTFIVPTRTITTHRLAFTGVHHLIINRTYPGRFACWLGSGLFYINKSFANLYRCTFDLVASSFFVLSLSSAFSLG